MWTRQSKIEHSDGIDVEAVEASGIDRVYLRVWVENFVILRQSIAAPSYFSLSFRFASLLSIFV